MEHFSQILSLITSFLPYIGVFFATLYCLIVFWVAKDISQRSVSLLLQIFSIFIVACIPFLGLFIYLLIRPELLIYKEIREYIELQK